MAEQTFTVGQVLTAAQMTTLQSNIGLTYITQANMTGSSLSINNCFTSTYRNYRIVVASTQASGNTTWNFRFRVGGVDDFSANYKFGQTFVTTVGATGVDNGNAGTEVRIGYIASANGDTETVMDIFDPQAAARTKGNYQFFGYDSAAWAQRQAGWMFDQTTQFDGITFLTGGSNFTATVYVYGYRQA